MKKYLPILLIFIFTLSACTCTQVDGKWVVNGECYGDLNPCSDSLYGIGALGNEWLYAYIDDLYVTNDLDVGGDVDIGGDLTVAGELDAPHHFSHEWDYLQDGTTQLGDDEVDIRDTIETRMMVIRLDNLADTTGWTVSSFGGGSGSIQSNYATTRILTGAVINSQEGLCGNGGWYFAVAPGSGYNHRFSSRVVPDTSTGMSDFWVGCFAGPAVYPTTISNHVAFHIINNWSNNDYEALVYASNGNGAANTQTAIISWAGQYMTFDFYWKYMDNRIRFYMNNALVATHTTNIPDSLGLYPGFWIENYVAANRQYQLLGLSEILGPE